MLNISSNTRDRENTYITKLIDPIEFYKLNNTQILPISHIQGVTNELKFGICVRHKYCTVGIYTPIFSEKCPNHSTLQSTSSSLVSFFINFVKIIFSFFNNQKGTLFGLNFPAFYPQTIQKSKWKKKKRSKTISASFLFPRQTKYHRLARP